MDRSRAALTWAELRVGMVVLASLAILAFTVLYIGSGGGSPFSRKYTLKALMGDVNGLKTGAPVRLGGVEVGTVTGVALADKGMVEVTLRLDGRARERITTRSRATLGSLGLLGEKAVDINPSTDGPVIPSGGYLPAEAQDPFKGLLADASESTQYMKKILARIDAGEGLIGRALRDEELYDRMTDVAVRLQKVATKLESDKGPLGRLVNDETMSNQLARSVKGIDAIVGRVESGQGALGVLTRDEQFVKELKDVSRNLAEVSRRLEKGEGSLGRLMTDETLYQRLDSVSQRMDTLVARLEKGEGSAGRLLNDTALYDNMNGAAQDLRTLLADVRKDPRKYLRVKLSVF